MPDGDYAAFVERGDPALATRRRDRRPRGREARRHDGVHHFTVGQRKGLGLAVGEPLYVVAIDAASQQVVVGPRGAAWRHAIARCRK